MAQVTRRTRTPLDGEGDGTVGDRRPLDELVELSHAIHAHPELSFEEVRSSALDGRGARARAASQVTAGTAGLPTAFVAEAGDGPLVLAICAEYDALPDVGHACGHNIIAAIRRRRRPRAPARWPTSSA